MKANNFNLQPSAEAFYNPAKVILAGFKRWHEKRQMEKFNVNLRRLHAIGQRFIEGMPDDIEAFWVPDDLKTITFRHCDGNCYWGVQNYDSNGDRTSHEFVSDLRDDKFSFHEIDDQNTAWPENHRVFSSSADNEPGKLPLARVNQSLESLVTVMESRPLNPKTFRSLDLEVELNWLESQFADPGK